MKVYELYCNIDIQSTIRYCYYDYDKEERIIITKKKAWDKEIKYLYSEDDVIYIEVDMEE